MTSQAAGRWVPRVISVLLCGLWFFGVLIPSTGRMVVDHSTTPPGLHIVGRARDIAVGVAVFAIPVTFIIIGARGPRSVEIVGWVLLGLVALLPFTK